MPSRVVSIALKISSFYSKTGAAGKFWLNWRAPVPGAAMNENLLASDNICAPFVLELLRPRRAPFAEAPCVDCDFQVRFGMKDKRAPRPPYNPGVRDLVEQKRALARPLSPDAVSEGFAGWYENGYLPHRDEPGLVQFVTFHLADAFPAALRGEWEAFLKVEDDAQRFRALESYLDKGRGECHLKRPEVAELVENALRFFHGKRYDLRAWVVMSNHVHVLFRVDAVPMAQILDSWKSYTAKEANKLLGRTGPFWQSRYWDTYMRDSEHEARTRRYIENNPVNAHLILAPMDWPHSSARFRDRNEALCLP